jgi:hypothetical protein
MESNLSSFKGQSATQIDLALGAATYVVSGKGTSNV